MRILKIVGIAVGVLVLAVGAVVAYVAATFDPNQYKPRIVQAVKEKTQRTLRLEGDIELSLWPNLGARIGRASLSERASEREFAAVEEARVSLKLLPLLSRQAVVDTVRVKGLRANLVRAKDGRTNVDDLAGPVPGKPVPEEAGARFTVDIAGVDIQDAAISYTDQMEGVKYAFSQLNIRTGRIAPGVPIPVELSVHARADKPKLDLRAALKARLTFDPPAQRYALEGLDLDARGEAAGITGLAATAKGDLDVRGATNEMSASKLVVSASGKQAGGDMMVKLDAPRLELTKPRHSRRGR
jgi:AsmA protein